MLLSSCLSPSSLLSYSYNEVKIDDIAKSRLTDTDHQERKYVDIAVVWWQKVVMDRTNLSTVSMEDDKKAILDMLFSESMK